MPASALREASSPEAPRRSVPLSEFDTADSVLYDLHHLCTFIADVSAAPLGAQLDGIKAESVQVVFGLLADRIAAARRAVNGETP